MKRASLFGLFLLLMYPTTAHASSNCGGNSCTLPSALPDIPEPEKPTTVPIHNIIVNGKFNANAADPSNEDDSFIYYFEHLDRKTEVSFEPTGDTNTNRTCTNCDSFSMSSSRQVGWTNSASFDLITGLNLGTPTATSTLHSSLSQTLGYSQVLTRTITKDFTLNCCSKTRFLDEITTETDRFLIGWQQDDTFGWTDMNTIVYSATNTSFGLTEITVDGECVTVPEPTSTLAFLTFGTLGAASTLKRKLKSSKSVEKELEKAS